MECVGIWTCEDCGYTVELTYEGLAEIGNPICTDPDCPLPDGEMTLLRVEVKQLTA